jgi:hypothetical protein
MKQHVWLAEARADTYINAWANRDANGTRNKLCTVFCQTTFTPHSWVAVVQQGIDARDARLYDHRSLNRRCFLKQPSGIEGVDSSEAQLSYLVVIA